MTPIPGNRPSVVAFRPLSVRLAVLVAVLAVAAGLGLPQPLFAVTEHVVQPGETLSAIADRYGLPIETLLDVNGLSDPDAIHAGQVLRIPTYASTPPAAAPGRYHVVQGGETLASLASRYGVSPEAIARANGIFDLHSVIAGATLLIPEGTSTPGTTVSTATSEPAAARLRHVVMAGETLSLIALRYGVSVAAIAEANGLADPDRVVEGQMLVIPGLPPSGAGGPAAPAARPDPGNPAVSLVHVVEPGETLSSIAARYGVALARLADANNLADRDLVIAGERLLIPVPSTPSQTTGAAPAAEFSHIVRPGDTLSAIAARYGVSMDAIVAANGIANPSIIVLGATLAIPGVAPASGPAASAPAVTAVGSHVVAAGETLASIAGRYGVAIGVIADLNGITDINRIIEGQVLSVPGVAAGRRLSLAEYQAILENAAAELGVSAALVKALAWQESGWNQYVSSHAGAIGLMQITPWTGDWALITLVPDAREWQTDPVANARMGVAILHHWLLRSNWDVETALAAYYQGWRSLHEIGMYEETKLYIANVLALIAQFE
jgi:LysM repeat protein